MKRHDVSVAALFLLLALPAMGCSSEPTGTDTPSAARPEAPPAPAAPPAPDASTAAKPETASGPAQAAAASAAAVKPASATTSAAAPVEKPREPAYRDITIPAGTTLAVELRSAVASDSSKVEDPVNGTLRRAVVVDGITAVPAGTELRGHVTAAEQSARVKGRASVAFRFSQLDLPGDRVTIRTGVIAREAESTKKQDAMKIGGGAAAGAVIGGIIGGGDGAAKGAAIGGAGGTGVVLSTRGKEVRLAPGTALSVKLLEAVTVRVKR